MQLSKEILRKAGLENAKIETLSTLLNDLERELKRPENAVPHVACVGIYNAGKSTLLNALIGENRFETGDIPTTKKTATWESEQVVYIDTPGLNAEQTDDAETSSAFPQADAFLYLSDAQSGGLAAAEAEWLGELQKQFADQTRFRQRFIPVISRCSEVESDRLPVVRDKFLKDYEKVLSYVPEKIFTVDSLTWFEGQKAQDTLLMKDSQIEELKACLQTCCEQIAKNKMKDHEVDVQSARQKVSECISELRSECQKKISSTKANGANGISLLSQAEKEIADIIERNVKNVESEDVRPEAFYFYCSKTDTPYGSIEGRSESSVRSEIKDEIEYYARELLDEAEEILSKMANRAEKEYGFAGTDSVYFSMCNSVNSVIENLVKRLNEDGIAVSFANPIQIEPDERKLRDYRNKMSECFNDKSRFPTANEYANKYSIKIRKDSYGYSEERGLFRKETVWKPKYYGTPNENCYKIKDHLNERGRYNVYRAFSVIQSAISSFGQELKTEADKRLAKMKADVEEYCKQATEKQQKPFRDADKHLSQLQDEVSVCQI